MSATFQIIVSTMAYSEVQSRWLELCETYHIPLESRERVWIALSDRYQEGGRFYHTLTHLDSLLKYSEQYKEFLTDRGVIDFSILFHDIIYDPKSKTNEEDSAECFRQLLGEYLDAIVVDKVSHYIIETKKHDVVASYDTDLQYFIDFDMSILGADRETYRLYCQSIRKEYDFYPDDAYCKGRAAFLRATINEGKRIFATVAFHNAYENQARNNILWECEQLESGHLI